MPESPPIADQSPVFRVPEPLEEAVEKAVAEMFEYALPTYCIPAPVTVARGDTGDELELPALVVRAKRLRESIPGGDVYELEVGVTVMGLMDADTPEGAATGATVPTAEENFDAVWAVVAVAVEDPELLAILRGSRATVTWHGLTREAGFEYTRADRHAERTARFSVHVSRLVA